MNNYYKETLVEIVKEYSLEELEGYLTQLIERRDNLSEWIRHVQEMRRKKKAQCKTLENGPRDGR